MKEFHIRIRTRRSDLQEKIGEACSTARGIRSECCAEVWQFQHEHDGLTAVESLLRIGLTNADIETREWGTWEPYPADSIGRMTRWGVAVVVACILLTPVIAQTFSSAPHELGDTYGMTNALFSGLAFLGVIVAIFYQRAELQLQRKELELTRNEIRGQREQLEGQKEQMELQTASFNQQQFESTFFRMIELHNQIVNGIIIEDLSGRACFHHFFKRLLVNVSNESKKGVSEMTRFESKEVKAMRQKKYDDQVRKTETIEKAYELFFYATESALGHYFRNLYHILQFVNEDHPVAARRYTNILRAQLSTYELALLFYNCTVSLGRDGQFDVLIEKYGLLKNLGDEHLIHPSHREWLKPSAYQGSKSS